MAFAAVLVLIYILMVGWFRSFLTPLIVMAAIPFSLVGILPAHGLLGAFFTATSMIGFMAGAGIVVRNSIILVDFIELRLAEGMPLAEAVVEAGMIRFRPDPADGAGGGRRRDGDSVRPDFPGPGHFADGGKSGFNDHRAGGGAVALLHGQRAEIHGNTFKDQTMTWIPLLVIAALAGVVWLLKKAGGISTQAALAHLKNGVVVIDVRSRGEFSAGHLLNTVNIPLDEIEAGAPKLAKDKNQVLLLHCASGMRSGVAQRKLTDMGYTNVFNLGSYGRARKIVGDASGH